MLVQFRTVSHLHQNIHRVIGARVLNGNIIRIHPSGCREQSHNENQNARSVFSVEEVHAQEASRKRDRNENRYELIREADAATRGYLRDKPEVQSIKWDRSEQNKS